MKEQDRRRAIRLKLARMEGKPAEAVATGFTSLDRALAGGWPRGRLTELFGPAGCGKTTLALQTIARLQERGLAAAWLDADHTFDPKYAATLHVDLERLPLAQPQTAEQALEMAQRLAASGGVDLVVLDSAAALVPRLELEAGIGESGPGLHSRVLASGLRRLVSAVMRTETSVIFLNQMRFRPDVSAGERETSSGGPALKLYAAVRVAVSRVGQKARLRVVKSKVGAAFSHCELEWMPGAGFAESL